MELILSVLQVVICVVLIFLVVGAATVFSWLFITMGWVR